MAIGWQFFDYHCSHPQWKYKFVHGLITKHIVDAGSIPTLNSNNENRTGVHWWNKNCAYACLEILPEGL